MEEEKKEPSTEGTVSGEETTGTETPSTEQEEELSEGSGDGTEEVKE